MIPVFTVLLLWVVPMLFFTIAYFKWDLEVRQKFKSELKVPLALFCVGFLVIGFLLTLSAITLAIGWIQHLGVAMVFISWFTMINANWLKGKTDFLKSILLLLLGCVGVASYGLLVTFI